MSGSPPPTAAKLRSCVTCRQRKVRCDKRAPCSNCRRADIACVFPSLDRPPRWARRIKEAAAVAGGEGGAGMSAAGLSASAGLNGGLGEGGFGAPMPSHYSQLPQQQQQRASISQTPGGIASMSSAVGSGAAAGGLGAPGGGLAADPRAGPRSTRDNPDHGSSGDNHSSPGVEQVMDRLGQLERLVTELGGQLAPEKLADLVAAASNAGSKGGSGRGRGRRSIAQTSGSGTAGGRSRGDSAHDARYLPPLPPHHVQAPQSQQGRLVSDTASEPRFVSGPIWPKMHDELVNSKAPTDGGDDDDATTSSDDSQSEAPPAARHAFLFGHNLRGGPPPLEQFKPAPQHFPYLFQIFVDNVSMLLQVVHVPSVAGTMRRLKNGIAPDMKLSDQALMFAVFYASVMSMEEEEIVTNLGSTKADAIAKYRMAVELALANADFLRVNDITLLQAFVLFLLLLRRHDSPRYVWMLTGLAIRMGQALGLHRDGAKIGNLTPYEVEVRRRVWWALCVLDVRASEDLGTELTIAEGTFDTELPLNINDTDIGPNVDRTPTSHDGPTDMSFSLVTYEMHSFSRQLMSTDKDSFEQQIAVLDDIYDKLERRYFRAWKDKTDITYWVGVTVARLVKAKLTLIVYLPTLFTSSDDSEAMSQDLRDKLFSTAIEVAELNAALNAERDCRHWRWLFQTYTQWHAIAFLLLEITRRPWSPLVERAWNALHNKYLIPGRANFDSKHVGVYLPLRKLMFKARRHRERELTKLQTQAATTGQLPVMDMNPGPPEVQPRSSQSGPSVVEQWQSLVGSTGAPSPNAMSIRSGGVPTPRTVQGGSPASHAGSAKSQRSQQQTKQSASTSSRAPSHVPSQHQSPPGPEYVVSSTPQGQPPPYDGVSVMSHSPHGQQQHGGPMPQQAYTPAVSGQVSRSASVMATPLPDVSQSMGYAAGPMPHLVCLRPSHFTFMMLAKPFWRESSC
jgi:hypothetical protein